MDHVLYILVHHLGTVTKECKDLAYRVIMYSLDDSIYV